MIRIVCVDTEHMDVEAEEKYTVRGERKIEGGEADKVDATLLVPAFDPSRSEANELYEQYSSDQTEWAQDYFHPIIQETYVDHAGGALFTESFADDGGYVFYDVSVQYIEASDEYRTNLKDVGWRETDNPPVVPEDYMYYEDTTSSLWYNVLIDEHDLRLDSMDISGQPPERPEDEKDEDEEGEEEGDDGPSKPLTEQLMDLVPDWTSPFGLAIGAMGLFTVLLAAGAFMIFGTNPSPRQVNERAGDEQVSDSLTVQQTVAFYQESAYAEFLHIQEQLNNYPLMNVQLVRVNEENEGYFRVAIAAKPKQNASRRYIRDFNIDLRGQAKVNKQIGSREDPTRLLEYSIPIATEPDATPEFQGQDTITKTMQALSSPEFVDTTYNPNGWAPSEGYLSQSLQVELTLLQEDLLRKLFYFPGFQIQGFDYQPLNGRMTLRGTLYSTG